MTSMIRLVSCFPCWLILSACLVAQDPIQWTLEPGKHSLETLRSIPFKGENRKALCSPSESTLVVTEAKPDGTEHWECFELPSLKPISSFAGPKAWDWTCSGLGSRYACSLVNQVLVTVDLTSGKQLPSVIVRTLHQPNILFDKAVWFSTGELFALPHMAPVKSHPLTSNLIPFADNENSPQTGGGMKHVWHPDAKHVVVNGITYNDTLRPESTFLGTFSSRDRVKRSPIDGFCYAAIAPPSDGAAAKMVLKLSDIQKVSAVPDRDPPQGDMDFFAFRGGLVAMTSQYMHVATLKEGQAYSLLSDDLEAHPIMIPPLVTFDGKRHRIQWLSKPADVPLEFSFNLGYEFSNDQHEIWYEKGATYFAEPELQKRLIAEIRQRAGAPAEATLEELIKSYKARNLWWISAYATATKIKFTGIPIEQAASVRYTHQGDQKFLSTSLILDFPEEELRKLWIDPPRLNTDFASLPQSVPGFIKLIAEPPPATESQIDEAQAVEPVVLPELPVRQSTLQTNDFTWVHSGHIADLMLIPIGVLLHFFCLTMGARLARAFGSSTRVLGGKVLPAAVASIGVVSFNLFSSWLLDVVFASETGSPPFLGLIKLATANVGQIAFGIWTFRLALEGPTSNKILIYLTTIFLNFFTMLVCIVLMRIGGWF